MNNRSALAIADCAGGPEGESVMTAVVASFKDAMTIMNVRDDLLSTGIPGEKIKVDKEHFKVRVMVPEQTKAEIIEILERHKPAEIH
jgi:N-acetylglutamate synthase/N-acetylornithine aminotransferase